MLSRSISCSFKSPPLSCRSRLQRTIFPYHIPYSIRSNGTVSTGTPDTDTGTGKVSRGQVGGDYSKCIMYKIFCKDETVKNVYVGHTVDLDRIIHVYKAHCNDNTSTQYTRPVFQFIRAHGGWDNWETMVIERFPCENRREADKRKRELQDALGATLNSNRAFTTPEEKKDYDKEYYEQNLESIKKMVKKYREENSEAIKNQAKQYYKENAEVIISKNTKRWEDNKATISLMRRERVICEVCGKGHSRGHAGRHRKSKFHLDFIINNKQ